MSDIDTAGLRRLLAAATPGPWRNTPNDRIVSDGATWPEGDPLDVVGCFGNKGAVTEARAFVDAALIAAAVNALPALLDAADERDAAVGQARADALTEAANAWTQGQWSDVMLPKPTPPAVPVIAYSNRMGDWLRARAESEATP